MPRRPSTATPPPAACYRGFTDLDTARAFLESDPGDRAASSTATPARRFSLQEAR